MNIIIDGVTVTRCGHQGGPGSRITAHIYDVGSQHCRCGYSVRFSSDDARLAVAEVDIHEPGEAVRRVI